MFTDIEGSTATLREVGPVSYAQLLDEHRRLLRAAVTLNGGVEVDTQGDAFFVAFPAATGAVAAAAAIQEGLAATPTRVRIGLHTGTPLLTDEGYVGDDVHLGARIAAAGHGGQVLLSSATRSLVDAEVSELGEHRLKDFAEPVAIYQLGDERFPSLKTISNTNLPRPASSFVGRGAQLADVLALLDDGARVVTLTGPGGSGKSRLALEAAAERVGRVTAGVFWVGLASVSDPTLVLPTIGQVLGAKGDVAAHIGTRQMVVLVDNTEQVIDAAGELSALVDRCPNLTLLLTSRERLRIRGETEYVVPPLQADEAIELFCARAGIGADADVAELCHRLDHLPLAVELAAARVGVLGPAQILARLGDRLDLLKGGRDAEARQQTLRATIDWSHALLSEDEQRLFARFAAFVGGAALESLEAVADADVDDIQSLVDKSLLRHVDGRFSMLETIREYAAEKLEQSDDATAVRQRHAEHFLQLAEDAEPTLMGLDPATVLDRLEVEHDNIRAALAWFESAGQPRLAQRLGGALWEFWCLRSHFNEGFRRLEHLTHLDPQPSAALAKVFTGAAHLSAGADAASAVTRRMAERAIEMHRAVGDDWGVAFAEHEYAMSLTQDGDFATVLPLMEESVASWKQIGDEHRELQAMRIVAWAASELGDPDRYRRIHEEILERAQRIGDHENAWWSMCNLARIASKDGRHVQAVSQLRQAHEIQLRIGDPGATDMGLVRLAAVLAEAGQADLAVQVLSLAALLHADTDFQYPGWFDTIRTHTMDLVRASLDEASFNTAWTDGRRLSVEEAYAAATEAVGHGPATT